MNKSFSVIIIVKGRRKQLENVLDSIVRSVLSPHDIQIIFMNEEGYEPKYADKLPIYFHQISSEAGIPLAAARNLGAKHAQTDTLVFLDVDCIVSPTLFASLLEHLNEDIVVSAVPLYLKRVPDHGDFSSLKGVAVENPSRTSLAFYERTDPLKFWSLIFAIRKSDFERINGFDVGYNGYGGEDTDFAMRFDKGGMSLLFVEDHVLHQYHDKYDPPYNHFSDIINNAERFKELWGFYPMKAWLDKFKEAGLIRIDDSMEVISRPNQTLIDASLSKQAY